MISLHGCSDDNEGADNLSISTKAPAARRSSGETSLSGVVMKGVIQNADCVVTSASEGELYNSTNEPQPCTNDRGRFAFSFDGRPSGPVMLTIKARAGSRMLCDHPRGCDQTRFGDQAKITMGFAMRAMLPQLEGAGDTEVNVTPWSDMATARALVLGGESFAGVTPDMVQRAHVGVADILNTILSLHGTNDAFDYNFVSVDPVNIGAPEKDIDVDVVDERKGALLSIASAAVLKLMDDSNFNSVEQVVRLVSTDFEDGVLNVNRDAEGTDQLEVIAISTMAEGIADVSKGLLKAMDEKRGQSLAAFLKKPTFQEAMDDVYAKSSKLAAALNAVTNQAFFSVKTGRASQQ